MHRAHLPDNDILITNERPDETRLTVWCTVVAERRSDLRLCQQIAVLSVEEVVCCELIVGVVEGYNPLQVLAIPAHRQDVVTGRDVLLRVLLPDRSTGCATARLDEVELELLAGDSLLDEEVVLKG